MTEEEKFDQQLPDLNEDLQARWRATLPLFVSIPRSGANWIQAVMELYFGRHRAGKKETSPSWLQTKWENPMWVHTHDNFGNSNEGELNTENPAIFLWRRPVDVVYSLLRLDDIPLCAGPIIAEKVISLGELYKKWTSKKNVLVLKYDEVVESPIEQMKRISEWFDVPFDKERARQAFETVGDIRNTNARNGEDPQFKNKESGTESYRLHRASFRNEWEEDINELFQEVLKNA